MTRFSLLLVCGMVPACLVAQTEPELQKLEQIVAVVGNEIVLQSDVDAQVFQMEASGMPVSDVCPVVEQLMLQKLLLHQARLDSIEVDDGEVTAQIDRRLEYYISMFGSVEAFEAEYGKTVAAWKAEFREPMREQIMADRMQAEIEGQVRATPRDIADHFASIPADSLPLIPEEVRYSRILIEPELSEQQKLKTREALDSIRTDVVAGKLSLTLAAMRHSEDPGSKYKGGCYEDIRRGQFVPEMEAQVFATPEGAFSPVFETDYGFHFVKTTNIRGEVFSMCHVLMKPTVPASALEEAGALADSVAVLLSADSLTFEEAVTRFSTEEDTKNQGGRVINPRTGGLFHGVDELERTDFFLINELRPGEHSTATAVMGAEQEAYALTARRAEAGPCRQSAAGLRALPDAGRSRSAPRQAGQMGDPAPRRDLPGLTSDFGGCDFDQNWFGETASGGRDSDRPNPGACAVGKFTDFYSSEHHARGQDVPRPTTHSCPIEAPARGLPRTVEQPDRLRRTYLAAFRPTQGGRRQHHLRPHPQTRLRAGGRRGHFARFRTRTPHPHGGGRQLHRRARPRQRLVCPRHSSLGVCPARPLPRQELRDHGQRHGGALVRLGTLPHRRPGAGP